MKKTLVRIWRRKELLFAGIVVLFTLFSLFTSWIISHSLEPHTNEVQSVQQSVGKISTKSTKIRPKKTMAPRDSSEESVGFVHVGKTGGSTISHLLRNGCTSFVSGPCRNVTQESVVSKMVEHYYHVPDFHRLPSSNHKRFIITVRDVYERTVSSFLYHHPKNAEIYHVRLTKAHAEYGPLAYSCFDTLDDFARLIHASSPDQCHYPHRHNVVDASDCASLACAALHGRVRFFVHLFFNFRNILYTKIPKDKNRRLFVLRQEHLWKDWEELNMMWGQTDPVYIPGSDHNQRNISGVLIPVKRTISSQGRSQLCHALLEEYVAYFQILRKAENIDDKDMEFSIQTARKNCPDLDVHQLLEMPYLD